MFTVLTSKKKRLLSGAVGHLSENLGANCLPKTQQKKLQSEVCNVLNEFLPARAKQAFYLANIDVSFLRSASHGSMPDTSAKKSRVFSGSRVYLQRSFDLMIVRPFG